MAVTPGHWHGHLALALSVACGAWAVILIRLAQHEGIPSLFISVFRLALAALILTPLVMRRHRAQISRLTGSDWLYASASGFLMALLLAAAAVALEHTSVLVASVLFAINPMWVALLEIFFLKTPMKQGVWLGLALTLGGSVIIALSGGDGLSLGRNPLLGAGLAAAGSLAVSIYAVVGRKVRQRIPLVLYMWLVFVTGAVAALVFFLVSGTPMGEPSAQGYLWLVLITLVTQLGSHVSYNYALRRLPATYCSIFGQLEVLFSAVIAFLLFSEIPGVLQLPGSIAILLGVAIVSLSQPQAD